MLVSVWKEGDVVAETENQGQGHLYLLLKFWLKFLVLEFFKFYPFNYHHTWYICFSHHQKYSAEVAEAENQGQGHLHPMLKFLVKVFDPGVFQVFLYNYRHTKYCLYICVSEHQKYSDKIAEAENQGQGHLHPMLKFLVKVFGTRVFQVLFI